MPIAMESLRVELARRNMTRSLLAKKLRVPPTTLSGWLNEAHPAPPNLAERVEDALRLVRGTLSGAS